MQYNNGQGFCASSSEEAQQIWTLLAAAFGGDSQVPVDTYAKALRGRTSNVYENAFGPARLAEMNNFISAVKTEINRIFEAKWEDAADVLPFE